VTWYICRAVVVCALLFLLLIAVAFNNSVEVDDEVD